MEAKATKQDQNNEKVVTATQGTPVKQCSLNTSPLNTPLESVVVREVLDIKERHRIAKTRSDQHENQTQVNSSDEISATQHGMPMGQVRVIFVNRILDGRGHTLKKMNIRCIDNPRRILQFGVGDANPKPNH